MSVELGSPRDVIITLGAVRLVDGNDPSAQLGTIATLTPVSVTLLFDGGVTKDMTADDRTRFVHSARHRGTASRVGQAGDP